MMTKGITVSEIENLLGNPPVKKDKYVWITYGDRTVLAKAIYQKFGTPPKITKEGLEKILPKEKEDEQMGRKSDYSAIGYNQARSDCLNAVWEYLN